jgi:hypothetical protein
MDLRKIAYTLLLNKYKCFEGDQTSIVINECLRSEKIPQLNEITINRSNENFDVNFIYSQIFKREVNSENNLNAKLKLLFASISYWCNGGLQENKGLLKIKNINFVRAFIVSFIKLALIDPVFLEMTSSNSSTRNEWLTNFDNQTTEKEKLITNYFSNNDNFLCKLIEDLKSTGNSEYFEEIHNKLDEIKKKFNLEIIHYLCEYQTVYRSINDIS